MADWLHRVSGSDVVYPEPPRCWQDGLLMGNGALGAVFFAPDALQWVVNKTDVLDGRTRPIRRIVGPDEAHHMVRQGAKTENFRCEELPQDPPQGAGPKSCCQLIMELGYSGGMGGRPSLPDVASRLSLGDATVHVDLDKHLFHPRVCSFVDAHSNTLAIRVRDVSPLVDHTTRLIFTRPEDIAMDAPQLVEEHGRVIMRMNLPEAGCYAAGIQVVPRAGAAYRDVIRARLRPKYQKPDVGPLNVNITGRFGFITVGGDFDVFVAVATSRDADDPAVAVHALLDRAATDDFDAQQRRHAQWWADFWSRSAIEISDKDLEQHFYRSVYALGATYRAGKTPIAGLCGLTYGPDIGPIQVTPWHGDLHHDLNVQCPFLPSFAINHAQLADAYLDTYLSFLPEARRLASQVFHARGATFDMAFNAMGRSMFHSLGTYRFFYGGSYIGLIHCLAWRYNRDVTQLRDKIYPFLRDILAFYLDIATRGTDGIYHFWPAHAPETNLLDVADPVQMVSMLKVCLRTAIEAAELLDVDESDRQRWQDMLEHLPPYPVARDEQGRQVIIDGVGIPPDHHVTQAGCLHPVYPCGEIDLLTNREHLDLYQATFDSAEQKSAFKTAAIEQGLLGIGGHPIFFSAMTALRLGRVDEFWNVHLPGFLRGVAKPNGLMSHNAAFVVDPCRSEQNIAAIPDGAVIDVDQPCSKWEMWCGHQGCSSPNPLSKRLVEPMIEANADFLTMLTETMLQSHNGVIRVFPAWPARLDGRFDAFLAEGNVAVSAAFRRGQVIYIHLQRQDPQCSVRIVRLADPWNGQIRTLMLPEREPLVLTSHDPDSSLDVSNQSRLEHRRHAESGALPQRSEERGSC